MSLENFSSFASCLNEISQNVRKITLNKSNLENNYKIKTDDSPFTKYDIEAENYIRKYLPNLGGLDISPVLLILIIYLFKDLLIEYWPRG